MCALIIESSFKSRVVYNGARTVIEDTAKIWITSEINPPLKEWFRAVPFLWWWLFLRKDIVQFVILWAKDRHSVLFDVFFIISGFNVKVLASKLSKHCVKIMQIFQAIWLLFHLHFVFWFHISLVSHQTGKKIPEKSLASWYSS